jgi:hypothetical protein
MNINGLITGSSYQDGQLRIEWRGDKKETSAINIGDEIRLRFISGRECIGYRSGDAGSLLDCPDKQTSMTTSQCPECLQRAKIIPCLRCDGEVCRNPSKRDFCVQPDNHALYLASFAPGVIKVGVSRWSRRQERLLEQGAKRAIVIARDDGQMIRRHEKMINKFGYPDRLSSQEKLRYLGRVNPVSELDDELIDAYEKIKPRMYAPWIEQPELVDLPEQKQIEGLEFAQLWRPNKEKLHSLVGEVKAVVGRLVILNDDNPQPFAIDVKDLVGYRVEMAGDDAKTGGQMQLSLF